MVQRIERVVLIILLCAGMLLALGGCRQTEAKPSEQETTEEPIDGGTTVHTDDNAPKVIESGNIAELSADFCLLCRWTSTEGNFFRFRIAPDENGVLTASEEILGIRHPADEALLLSLQEIIEREDLVQRNGVYEVTAGLAPEYQPCTLTVLYASGEKLYFTIDNDPYAAWSAGFYDVFAAWFSARGEDALYPEKETSEVGYVHVTIAENGVWTEYCAVDAGAENAVDGQTRLFEKDVFDTAENRTVSTEYRTIPDDFYARVTEILAETDLSIRYEFSYLDHGDGYFGAGTHPDGETDAEDASLSVHIEYASGRTISIDTRKPSEIAALKALLSDLFAYCDSLFA